MVAGVRRGYPRPPTEQPPEERPICAPGSTDLNLSDCVRQFVQLLKNVLASVFDCVVIVLGLRRNSLDEAKRLRVIFPAGNVEFYGFIDMACERIGIHDFDFNANFPDSFSVTHF